MLIAFMGIGLFLELKDFKSTLILNNFANVIHVDTGSVLFEKNKIESWF